MRVFSVEKQADGNGSSGKWYLSTLTDLIPSQSAVEAIYDGQNRWIKTAIKEDRRIGKELWKIEADNFLVKWKMVEVYPGGGSIHLLKKKKNRKMQ